MYKKPAAEIICISESLDVSFYNQEQGKGVSSHAIWHSARSGRLSNMARKGNKSHIDQVERCKTAPVCRWDDSPLENTKENTINKQSPQMPTTKK